MSKIKTVLLRDTPEAVSPWRTDIENAPRKKGPINIVAFNDIFTVYPIDNMDEYLWEDANSGIFKNSEITHWIPIPELPEL